MAELTEYEKLRAARVARNQQILAALELDQAAEDFASEVQNFQKQQPAAKSMPEISSTIPTRRSERLLQTSTSSRKLLREVSSSEDDDKEGRQSDAEESDTEEENEPSGARRKNRYGRKEDDVESEEKGEKDEEEEYRPMADEVDSEEEQEAEVEEEEGEEDGEAEDIDETGKGSKKSSGRRASKAAAARRYQTSEHQPAASERTPRGGQAAVQALSEAQASLVAELAAAAASHGDVEIDEDELALQQAMALSLGETVKGLVDHPPPSVLPSSLPANQGLPVVAKDGLREISTTREGNLEPRELATSQHDEPSQKRRKSASQPRKKRKTQGAISLSPTDVDAMYFLFDERGRGAIRPSDIARVSVGLEFHWSEDEIADMVSLFSTGGESKLTLQDFHATLARCGMLAS